MGRARITPPANSLLSVRPTSSSIDSDTVSMPSVPLPRAELLHVLMLPDFDWVDRIGWFDDAV